MAHLEPGSKVVITQHFEGHEETRVITGWLTEMRHDVDNYPAMYDRPGGGRLALGGPMRQDVTLTVAVDTVGIDTNQKKHARNKKEQTTVDPANDFRFETVREPRTKMITLYCRDVDSDELYYGWDLVPVEVPKGAEPPVFLELHEDIFRAMKQATGR